MAKASFTLPDGTTVLVEGSPDEIHKIISLHSPGVITKPQDTKQEQGSISKLKQKSENEQLDITAIVNSVKSSDEVELIEKNILDNSNMVDRVLLPLYIVHKYFHDKYPLTSGEISKTLFQLGITIYQSNTARTLSSTASKYVMGDKVRIKGQAVRYRLSRRGVQYISSVIKGMSHE